MRRLPLLLIALFLILVAGAVLYFGFTYSMATTVEREQMERFLSLNPNFVGPILFAGAFLIGFLLWLGALIHMLSNRALAGNDKVVWTLVIIFLSVLGAILYFVLAPTAKPPFPPAAASDSV